MSVAEANAAWDVFFTKLSAPAHTHEDLPEGCKCDPTDWRRGCEINELCGQAFEPDPNMPTVCVRCEHHQECHS